MRSVSDTAVLGAYWSITAVVDDRSLFEAAFDIARDGSASTQARVFALLAINRSMRINPTSTYSNLVGGWVEEAGLRGVKGGCATRFVSHATRETGTPLPNGWQQAALRLRSQLLADDLAPLDVRTAAWCIPTTARRE
jgi:hypothetical protein